MFETTSQKCISKLCQIDMLRITFVDNITPSQLSPIRQAILCLLAHVRSPSEPSAEYPSQCDKPWYTHYIYILYCKQQFAEDFAQPMVMFIDYWLYHITGSVLSL
jgi:hypothetical protein